MFIQTFLWISNFSILVFSNIYWLCYPFLVKKKKNMWSLFLKALSLMTLRRSPSLPKTKKAITFKKPKPKTKKAITFKKPKPLNQSLQWISRTHHCGELSSNDVGKTVRLCGWAELHRRHGGVAFLILRDHTGIIQVTTRLDEFPVAHSRCC